MYLVFYLYSAREHCSLALYKLINYYSHGTRANKVTLWHLHVGITQANKFILCHYLHGASPGQISSHSDVTCTGHRHGGITRANKFTLWRYLLGDGHGGITWANKFTLLRYQHRGITRANDLQMWTRYVLLFPGTRGLHLFSPGAAPGLILSRALPPC